MGKFRGFDSDEGWIKRRFLKIEKQMREDRAAKRASSTTIGNPGLTIAPGGSLVAKYPASEGGGEATRFGPAAASGPPGYAFKLLDETGQVVFYALREYPTIDFPTGTSQVSIFADDFTAVGTGAALYRAALDAWVSVDPGGVSLNGGPSGVFATVGTTGSAANANIDASTGQILRSTSSLRYKQDVEDAEVDPTAVLNMQPRTWRDKAEVANDPDIETRYVGFIAEELHELGLGQFVVYDADGDPEAISYDRLTVALLAVLKDLSARVETLEADDA